MHIHQGKIDIFTQSEGLSDDHAESLFEDLEGNVWIAPPEQNRPLPRIRRSGGRHRARAFEFPRCKRDAGAGRQSLAWQLGGLDRWKDGEITAFRKPKGKAELENARSKAAGGAAGQQMLLGFAHKRVGPTAHYVGSNQMPDSFVCSTFQDAHGRIWMSTFRGLAYFEDGKISMLAPASYVPPSPVVGDSEGNLWMTNGELGLSRLRDGKLVERIPWSRVGIKGALRIPSPRIR